MSRFLFITLGVISLCRVAFADSPRLRVATFDVDASPPIGSPVLAAPARTIEDPLSARGIVLLGAGSPIVLCAFDWEGISNDGHLFFRERLAQAAGTTASHVAVHSLHQHDGPRCDFRTEELMTEYGYAGTQINNAFCRHVMEQLDREIRSAIPKAREVTHLGIGTGIVEKVASNRRILGKDGKRVEIVRLSRTEPGSPAQLAPEGLIDPEVKMISFWENDQPLAALSYYATHPQSYYGQGDVTSDFVGLARARRDQSLPDVLHVHFNGAGGNIAAGKYNDGTPKARVELTDRMEAGLKKAWEATVKQPLSAADVRWDVETVSIPVSKKLEIAKLRESMANPKTAPLRRLYDAQAIAWLERDTGAGVPVELSCLTLGKVSILHMPGELFVEYQLAAQKMRPDQTVCMAAYGEYAPLYIGTEVAYSQGGFEIDGGYTNVSPAVEQVLLSGIKELLKQ